MTGTYGIPASCKAKTTGRKRAFPPVGGNLADALPEKRAEMDRRLKAIRKGLEKIASNKKPWISAEDDARFETPGYIK